MLGYFLAKPGIRSRISQSMNLELQQILTQIVGFLIALWILKKFAWKPLLNMLEQRRQKIKSEFSIVEEQKRKAQLLLDEYEAKLKEIDSLARIRIQGAVADGQKVAAEIRENARQEASERLNKARLDLEREIAKAKVQLRNDMVEMTLAASRKLIKENLDQSKHRQLISDFISEIEQVQ